ncbi:hypothetical protein RGUI_0069 (plasmid) [Rhodovulum sp. P5]|uniref:hypothetical protein n=1 Tax=Rhodovulum sp. P5 TaxID=1564506 RepID=UPI0009C2679F|nr:hypothetical protein [Rhodovulum sp. P5]ARE42427.1 hypothetical protein RGUI_0069 [Rhodovulum sp. P5]
MSLWRFRAAAIGFIAGTSAAASGQESSAYLSIELNALSPAERGCTISFLVRNGHDRDIAAAVFETVLIDANGQVDRLTLFDFGALPAGRPRVRQFALPDLSCGDLGLVLINGVSRCEAGDLGAKACSEELKLSSRTDVELAG